MPTRVLLTLLLGLSLGFGAAAPALAQDAAEESTWSGHIVYDDDTVVYDQLDDSIEITRVAGTDTFVVGAFLSYTTADSGGLCEFTWIKSFNGQGTLDTVGGRLVFAGTEKVSNVSTCPDSNTRDDERETQVFGDLDGGVLTGVVFNGTFEIAGFLDEEGIVEVDGQLFLTAPEGGTLSFARDDLPDWARDLVVTVGAQVLDVGPPDTISTGDETILLDGRPVARLGDATTHGGTIVEGSPDIFVNGEPAAFAGGMTTCPMQTGFVPHVGGPIVPQHCTSEECLSQLSGQPIAFTTAPAGAGDTSVEIDGAAFEVGDTVIIGTTEEDSETAVVSGKGSLLFELPLELDHPAESAVTRVPDEYLDLIEGPGVASSGSVGGDSSGNGRVMVLAGVGVVALIVAGAVLLRRRVTPPQR